MRSVFASAVLAATLATSLITPTAGAQASCVQASSQHLIVYHAGSLTAAFTPVEKAFTCQTGVQVQDMTGGSVDLLRQVTAGGKTADIVASADYVDIDNFLKPAGVASYNIVFAHGRMVLGYTESGVGPAGKNLPPVVDPAGPAFNPPTAIPTVVDNWYQTLLTPGVVIGGSHPFLDPSGYRSHLMFQLMQAHYDVPNLANNLLQHYLALPAAAPANAFAIGTQYDFQLIYEHSALGIAQTNPDYRYAYLPDDIDLSNPAKNEFYKQAVVTMPGLGIPGQRRIGRCTGDAHCLGSDDHEVGTESGERDQVPAAPARARRHRANDTPEGRPSTDQSRAGQRRRLRATPRRAAKPDHRWRSIGRLRAVLELSGAEDLLHHSSEALEMTYADRTSEPPWWPPQWHVSFSCLDCQSSTSRWVDKFPEDVRRCGACETRHIWSISERLLGLAFGTS